eukprot:1145437-Pelagomonas_calceolata.AAC.3
MQEDMLFILDIIISLTKGPYSYVTLSFLSYISHALENLKELDLDTHIATMLALKLHTRPVQHAY